MSSPTPLGIKRQCPSCGNRFYDLNRKPATCPKCAHSYDPTVPLRQKRARRVPAEAAAAGDALLQHMAKARPLPSKAKKDEPKEEIEVFEGGGEQDMEELESMDDIEALEEIEDIEEESDDELEADIALDEGAVGAKSLIDTVEEEEESEEEEEKTPARSTTRKKAAPPKRRK